MESPLFGWELLWTIIEDTIRSPSDLIVAFVHWQMIKFSFSCLGTGDEVTNVGHCLLVFTHPFVSCRNPFRAETVATSVFP